MGNLRVAVTPERTVLWWRGDLAWVKFLQIAYPVGVVLYVAVAVVTTLVEGWDGDFAGAVFLNLVMQLLPALLVYLLIGLFAMAASWLRRTEVVLEWSGACITRRGLGPEKFLVAPGSVIYRLRRHQEKLESTNKGRTTVYARQVYWSLSTSTGHCELGRGLDDEGGLAFVRMIEQFRKQQQARAARG